MGLLETLSPVYFFRKYTRNGFRVKPTQVILDETPVTWEWHYPIRSALWLTPVLFICKIFYFIGIYPFINVQLLLRIFTATLSAYAESKFLDFTFRMFQIFEISSNYFYLSLLSWLRFKISATYGTVLYGTVYQGIPYGGRNVH